MPGLFVSFEGVDGVGKSTQALRLRDYLRGLGYRVTMTREPGGTPLGAIVRGLLLHGVDGVRLAGPDDGAAPHDVSDDAASDDAPAADISPRTEALLYAADRAQHVAEVIRPALENGGIVISDRYIDSSLAYQAGGRELTPDDIRMLSEWATDGLWPGRTYLLDMDFRASSARLTGDADRLESSGAAFFDRTRRAFLDLAHDAPARFRVVDASLTVDDVWDAIRADADILLAQHRDDLERTAPSAALASSPYASSPAPVPSRTSQENAS